MTRIKDLTVGRPVEGYYALLIAEEREFSDSSRGSFLHLELADKTGQAAAKWWDWQKSGMTLDQYPIGSVVKLRGKADSYRDQKQILISRLRPAEEGEYSIDDLIRTSPRSEEEIVARISALRELVENEHIRRLSASFFDDQEIFAAYLRASAAERNHHAYVRGLAEHSCNVTEVAVSLAEHYSEVDKDLLVIGGLLHDYGKIRSYDISTSIHYSLEGRLVDHISIADAEVTAHAGAIEGFPATLRAEIRHLILSHHGERMYGSPVEPKTPEAILLNYADLIDSRMEMVRNGRNAVDSGGWSYVKPLRRNIYYGTPEPESGAPDSGE
ncbi:MAG: 3'-5' exoribonuclease YhaM family protein [Candidatus Zixiibacteriota bacterium]